MQAREIARISFAARCGDAAAAAACRVDGGVTKHVTILVVGDQGIRKLNGHQRSSSQMKAEDLIRKGLRRASADTLRVASLYKWQKISHLHQLLA